MRNAVKEIAALPAEKRTKAIKQKAAKKGKRERKPVKKSGKRDVKSLIKKLRESGYDGGYNPATFAADVLEYAFGLTNKGEFEEAHPEIFGA